MAQRDRQIHRRSCQIEIERLKERHREGERGREREREREGYEIMLAHWKKKMMIWSDFPSDMNEPTSSSSSSHIVVLSPPMLKISGLFLVKDSVQRCFVRLGAIFGAKRASNKVSPNEETSCKKRPNQ